MSTSGALIDTKITWPLANAGDETFQPDGVANNAVTMRNPAAAVNGILLQGSVAGAAASLATVGGDAAVGLQLAPKGGGDVSAPNVGLTVGTTITVGTSDANQAVLNGAAAGAPVKLSAQGADANIDLSLAGKGTGVIRFGYASVPVSGLTAATLGNTGGGPATSTQYGWRKTTNSDGTAEFHPVWR